MGSLSDLFAKLPFGDMLPSGANLDDSQLVKIQSMINSMTKAERINPKLLDKQRVLRVSKGSGRSVSDVNDLVTKFFQMKKVMGTLGKSTGLLGKIPGMGQLKQMKKMKGMNLDDLMSHDPEHMQHMMEAREAKRKSQAKKIDKDKNKNKRKTAKKARKRK